MQRKIERWMEMRAGGAFPFKVTCAQVKHPGSSRRSPQLVTYLPKLKL